MKALPLLLTVLLAWLGVASGYHLVDAPHFWGGGGPVPFPLIWCLVRAGPPFGVAVALLGLPALLLLAWLAAGPWPRRAGAARRRRKRAGR
jgi:hypothetical protein